MTTANGKIEGRINVWTTGTLFTVTETGGGGASQAISFSAPSPDTASDYIYHSSPGSAWTGNNLFQELEDALNSASPYTSALNATYDVSLSETTGKYTITASGGSVSAIAISWDNTDFRDLLGFDANVSGALTHTGADQARSLWLPDCPFNNLGGDDFAGYYQSDKREAVTSAGHFHAVMGQKRRVLDLKWGAITRAKALVAGETTTNTSFERFMIDAIFGEATWASTGGPVAWYPDLGFGSANRLGEYSVPGFQEWRPIQTREDWVGRWVVRLDGLIEVPS